MGIAQVPSFMAPHNVTMHSEEFQEGFKKDVPTRETVNAESPEPLPPTGQISERFVESSKDISVSLSFLSRASEPAAGDYPTESQDELVESPGRALSSWDGERTKDGYLEGQHEVRFHSS